MAYVVEPSNKARHDLEEIYAYYSDTKYLLKFVGHWESLLSRLEHMPKSGVEVGIYRKAIIMKRHIVFYKIIGQKVRIARIFDGRTDYQK